MAMDEADSSVVIIGSHVVASREDTSTHVARDHDEKPLYLAPFLTRPKLEVLDFGGQSRIE
jgi:hypothetical protein